MIAEEYQKMLKEVFPFMKIRHRMFQQDGARIHTAEKVTQFLNQQCKAGGIGLGSATQEWPPYSPDIAPCDYGLWPYMLPRIKRRCATNLHQLKEFVFDEFQNIPDSVIVNICEGMVRRCKILKLCKGGNVEHVAVEE